jgi:hypothetical protein
MRAAERAAERRRSTDWCAKRRGKKDFDLERTPPNKSDHVIRVQLLFATKARHPSRGGS